MPLSATGRTLAPILLLAAAYLVAGKLGLLLAIPPGYATAIFPPAGIALAALLLYGNRVWPGILLGSTSMNLWISLTAGASLDPQTVVVAVSIGTGATLQALIGAALIRRYVGLPTALDNERDVLTFLLLGGPLSCLINASVGGGTLWLAGVIGSDQLLYSWWTWWVGDTLGVVIITPLLFIFLAQPRNVWASRRASVAIPLALTFTIIVAIFFRASTWESEQLRLDFQDRAKGVVTTISTNVSYYLGLLESIDRFYASSTEVSREQFATFVTRTLAEHPGIQALEWIPRITADERSAFEAAQQSIIPGFAIRERDADGTFIAADQRAEYFPVTFIEPLAGNEQAVGYDLGSNPIRRQAMLTAETRAELVLTAPLRLVQERAEQIGILALHPVYFSHNATADAEQRLRGFAAGVFRMGDLINTAVGSRGNQIELSITDITAENAPAPIFDSITTSSMNRPTYNQVIDIGGRHWQVMLTPTELEYIRHQSIQSWFILAIGLLFAGLLGAFLLVVTGNAVRIATLVAARTDELQQANTTIGDTNRMLGAISQAQTEFISASDKQVLFDRLLGELLAITDSEYGFIGEVLLTPQKTPYLKTKAITNIAWNAETQDFYEKNAPQGMEFYNLNSLFGNVMVSGEPVIANTPAHDPRRGGLPSGHPPLNAFLGLPFFKGERMVGMVGIANRPGGYDQQLIDHLQPLLRTLANIIDAQQVEMARKASEQALSDSESRMRAIFENAGEAIVTFDAKGTIKTINPAGERLFGYKFDEIIDHPWHYLFPLDFQQNLEAALSSYLAHGAGAFSNSSSETECKRLDGTMFPAQVAVSAVCIQSGVLFTALVHDLSERVKVERLKSEFVSTISHELRTPLTSILGSLGLINGGAAGAVPAPQQPLLETAYRNSQRLLNLINDILDVEKIAAGKLSITLEPHGLVPLAQQAIESNRGFAEKFGVKLMLTKLPPQDICANIDDDRFIQVLNNLISNAIKFSPEGGTVELGLSVADNRAIISVTDHGPGVPESFRDRVFVKFAQADASDTRQHAGTGLGLNISQALIEQMQGSIGFECPAGGGTIFTVSLPLAESDTTLCSNEQLFHTTPGTPR